MNKTTIFSNVSVEHLARRLESDVRNRSLRSGDRYLSTRQVGRLFGVNLALANQAIQKLVDDDLLVRRDRSGTYIGTRVANVEHPHIKTVHVLRPESRSVLATLPTGPFVDVLHVNIPSVSVQFNYLPREQDVAYVQTLVGTAQASGQLTGVVAISCSREVYRLLGDMHVPTVVFGSLDPDQQNLPSVDEDNFEAGRLLAEYLIQQGHKRLGLLYGGCIQPGDHHFFDGITEAMAQAGLAPNSLVMRDCPNVELLHVRVKSLLDAANSPTGIICRGHRMFDLVLDVASDLGLTVPDDMEIVFDMYAVSHITCLSYPHVQSKMSLDEIISNIAQMLQSVHKGQLLEKSHVIIPVEMCVPESSGYGRMAQCE